MQKQMCVILIIAMLLLLTVVPIRAQDGPQPQRVEITAPDSLTLVGDLYLPAETAETGAPAAVLLHMLYSTRGSWETLIIPLVEAGYAVLSVDLRGHGETGGTVDWKLADQDIQNWIDWLSQQPGIDPNGINLIGASIGGNLALRGIAANEQIVTSIALSPGLDYQGVTTEDVMKGLPRPIFLAVAQDDGSASSVKTLAGMVRGAGLVRYYTGSRHGTQLLNVPDLIPTMIFWLDLYNQAN